MDNKPRLGLDLDGTLYDSFPIIIETGREVMKHFGYEKVSEQDFKEKFHTRDWRAFYRSLGFEEKDIDPAIKLFIQKFACTSPPPILPGAKEAILLAEKKLGKDSVYFITNDPMHRVIKRFEKDGLLDRLERVQTPYSGKSQEIFDLASQDLSRKFVYIGDILCDAEDCAEARKMGATNVLFYGMTHKYSFNPAEYFEKFASKNPEFAKTLKTLDDISQVWNQE